MSLDKTLKADLDARKVEHLYRSRKVLESPQSIQPIIEGKKVLSFCSNDYLGLANHPEVINSFKQAADKYGVGSGSAHLVSGHSAEHHLLEEELATFMGTERALLFSTGYMANLGVLSALCDRHSEIYEDKLNHASLLDAALLSRAKRIRYPHLDIKKLKEKVASSSCDNKFIISDAVFSMDGDYCPLDTLVDISTQHDATLIVDDAHGIGVLGKHGRGVIEEFSLSTEQVPIIVGTLGKALGTAGAFVAGSEALIETLIQKSRSYIYTTAMPMAVAAATRTSLGLVEKESWRRDKLRHLIALFKQQAAELGLEIMPSDSAIQPIIIGSSEEALVLSEKLLEEGILISAIRPPTVAENSARLRITFSAEHTEEHIGKLLSALTSLMNV